MAKQWRILIVLAVEVVVEVGVQLAAMVEVLKVGLVMVALFLSIVVMAGVVRMKNLFLVLRKI